MMICASALGGCAGSAANMVPQNVAVSLPAKPAYMAPVPEPVMRANVDDARLGFRAMRGSLRKANARLTESAGWYDALRRRYAGKKAAR